MSILIDAIIICAALFIIISGTKKGFVKSIMGLLSTAASLIAAYAYTPVLAEYIKDKFLLDRISGGISDSLKSFAIDPNTGMYNLDKLAHDLPEKFVGLLERYGFSLPSFLEQTTGVTSAPESAVDRISAQIAESTSSILASVIAFIVIFVGALIALAIITALLDLIFKLPVLKTANTFFGFVFAAIQAVISVYVIAFVSQALVDALIAVDPSAFSTNTISDTVICKFLLEHNIFTGLFGG